MSYEAEFGAERARVAIRILAVHYDPGRRPRPEPPPPPEPLEPTPGLRPRHVEILEWIALGKTSAEIALILGITKKTVDEHVQNTFRILSVYTRPQAVFRALALGLISLPDPIKAGSTPPPRS